MNTDAYLCHSHDIAAQVEAFARRLEDECGLKVWLDKWSLIPGKSWQEGMTHGLDEAGCCVVFVGPNPPEGWVQQEIERALAIQARNPDFRVLPVLLPGADEAMLGGFLGLRTWADFRDGHDHEYAFRVLRQGIRGEPIGRGPDDGDKRASARLRQYEEQFRDLAHFKTLGVTEEVIIEYQRKVLDRWIDDRGEC